MAPDSNSFHGQMLLGVGWSQLLYFCSVLKGHSLSFGFPSVDRGSGAWIFLEVDVARVRSREACRPWGRDAVLPGVPIVPPPA